MVLAGEVRRLVRLLLLAPTATLAIAGWLASAQGNFAPPVTHEAILFHVQPVTSGFCNQDYIWECSQVRQYTEATGLLEFDLFVYSNRPEGEVSLCGLDLPLAWSADWALIDWECCHQGEASLVVGDHAGIFSLAWQDNYPRLANGLLLIARFIMDVEGCGWFGVSGVLDQPALRLQQRSQELDIWWALPGWGQAGVTCEYCYIPCDLHTPCRPELRPQLVELQACVGAVAEGSASCWMYAGCQASYETTAAWLEVEPGDPVPSADGTTQEITIWADTENLSEGMYEAYVRATDECVGCTRVILSVTPRPPVTTRTSWGELKGLYR